MYIDLGKPHVVFEILVLVVCNLENVFPLTWASIDTKICTFHRHLPF